MTGVVAPLASPLLSGLTDVRGWCPSTATSSRTFGQHALLKRKARRARTVRLPVRQGEPAGCAVRFFHSPRAEILVAVVRLAVSGLVEEIVGRVRHKRQMPDVCWRATARRRCNPSRGVQPLDEGGLRQRVATGGSVFGSNHRDQEPGNRIGRNEGGVGGGIAWFHLA